MSAASPVVVADEGRPSLMTRVAVVVLVLALAGVAAYAVFSGPTTVSAPTGARPGATKAPPPKVAPAGEEQAPEPREGAGGG